MQAEQIGLRRLHLSTVAAAIGTRYGCIQKNGSLTLVVSLSVALLRQLERSSIDPLRLYSAETRISMSYLWRPALFGLSLTMTSSLSVPLLAADFCTDLNAVLSSSGSMREMAGAAKSEDKWSAKLQLTNFAECDTAGT
jgi:hypothetical protein